MRIFLDAMGPYPYISVGGQALMFGAMEILRRRFRDAEFVFFCKYPDHERLYLDKAGLNITTVKRSHSQLIAAIQARRLARSCDLVVSVWGDGYITYPPHLMYRKVFFLKTTKTPLVLFTSSMGPFAASGLKRWMAKAALQRYDYLSVRDTLTLKYLEDLGLDKVDLIPDTAFALKPAPSARIDEILSKEGIPSKLPYVGINLGIEFMNYCMENGIDFVDICVKLINRVRRIYRHPVLFIPHQFLFPQYDYGAIPHYTYEQCDDRYPIDKVWATLDSREDLYRLRNVYTCSELKGIIGRSVIFICNRIHPSVAATSQCVPTAILHYTHKAKGMMDLIEKGDYVWYAKPFHGAGPCEPPPSNLLDVIDELWEKREEYRNDLHERMPGLIDSAFSLGDRVCELVEN